MSALKIIFLVPFSMLCLMASASAQMVPASKTVVCQYSFLQANESVFGAPEATIVIKPLPSIPTYDKWAGEWTQKVVYGKNEDKEFTIKSHVTLQARGSIWFLDPKYRLQAFTTIFDKDGRVLLVFREHTDRIVRDYQIEEIKNDNPTLRLAIPFPSNLETVYSNPETMAVAAEQGPEEAFTLAVRRGLIEPEVVREMGVLCYLQ
jgi:hypothetical protein